MERETCELVLAAITQGRLLAHECWEAGLVPKGTTRSLVTALLKNLGQRQRLEEMDEERIDMVGDQIRAFMNEYMAGLGDQALIRDVETDQIFDAKALSLVNLARRWRQFRGTKIALDDKLGSGLIASK
jgi:hypothetical protein